MTPERWEELKRVLAAALERKPQERPAYLDQVCAEPSIRRELESLIAAHEQGDSSFMERPLVESGMLKLGAKLGPYEILGPLGAGGMGEVYRARDSKLGRDVAIKVLPTNFVNDPERLSRFQREARMLAALNHPNIATIHGIEQSDSVRYLVMELVPGETLAGQVSAGALSIEESLKICGQIAEALEAAHEKGVIHRDLKPANVKVTPEGRVKVLDFGLAKASGGDGGLDLSNAVTLTAMGTEEGRIVGTPAYMSPEQARGKPVDKRTDIWAFGCVLYEMLTGKQAFRGETVSDTLAALLEREPDWQALPPVTPAKIRDLLRRCLQKDVNKRCRDAGDVRTEIEEALAAPPTVGASTPRPATRGWRDRLTQAGLAVFVLTTVALAIGFALRALKPPQSPQPVRLNAEIGADASLDTSLGPSALLSPDGTRLVLVASGADQKRHIYVRSLDQLQATALSDTEGAPMPSSFARWPVDQLFADGKLKKISVQGGAAATLCDALDDRGGSWGEDGTIVFEPNNRAALSKISSAGGTPQPLTTLDRQAEEVTQRWPQVLPGGKAVLFTSSSSTAVASFEDAEIIVYSMASGKRKTVQRGGLRGGWPVGTWYIRTKARCLACRSI